LINHRISTTISEKHWKLLKKYTEIFETQKKTLEFALESLENGSKKNVSLTPEEQYWVKIKRAKSLIIIEKSAFRLLIETADVELINELFIRDKTIEYIIEFYFQKSLEECSLKEVIDGLVINLKIANLVDTIDCIKDISYYKLMITHSFGSTFSKLVTISIENMFKAHGFNTESICSIKTIFIKIF
jgi:hypothetical protein